MVPMCHQHSYVEVPHVASLIHHQLLHLLDLEALELGLHSLDVEQVGTGLVVN